MGTSKLRFAISGKAKREWRQRFRSSRCGVEPAARTNRRTAPTLQPRGTGESGGLTCNLLLETPRGSPLEDINCAGNQERDRPPVPRHMQVAVHGNTHEKRMRLDF